MANNLYARMPLQNFPLLRRLVALLALAIVFNMLPLPGAAAVPLKYSHSSLVSALTGRPSSPAYGSLSGGGGGGLSDAVDDVVGAGGSVDSVNSAAAVAAAAAAAAAALKGSGGSGGEVLVPKTFPMSPQEPTCEQLRAMWIFSKRQSRAAEMTNEIPTYRDPFAYNIWEPYYSTTRSMGALRVMPRYGERSRSPVFGRVISREPLLPQRVTIGHRQRHYSGDGGGGGSASGSGSRIYGAESKANYPTFNGGGNARRPSQYRYVGANGSAPNGATPMGNQNSVAVQGSFQKLKELIWTERAKELTQQRRAEELAARAAVLKEIANGQNIMSNYKPPFKSESSLMDENRSPDLESYQHDGRMSIATGQSYVNNNKNYDSNNNNNKNYNANTNNNNKNYISNNNKNERGSNSNKSQNNNKNGGNKEVGIYTPISSGMAGRAATGGNTAAVGSSTRSFGASNTNSNMMLNNNNNNNRAQQKSAFAGNSGVNSGRSGRLMLPGAMASSYGGEEVGRQREREREHNYGIPKSYPVRPSHFRERNRSLFKQRSPADYFERDVRNPETMRNYRGKESLSIGQLIGNLNRRNRVLSAGGDDLYRSGLSDMFSTQPRLLASDNALSSPGLLGLVDGIDVDDDNIEAFLDYIDPVVSLMAYQGNNANEQSGELYDYSSYY